MEPRLIDKVLAHHRASRTKVEVPEWGVDIYFGPLTTSDMIAARARAGSSTDEDGNPVVDPGAEEQRRLVLLVAKAEFEDGTAAFNYGDIEVLKTRAHWSILQRLIAAMYQSSVRTVAEGKDESTSTTSSASA